MAVSISKKLGCHGSLPGLTNDDAVDSTWSYTRVKSASAISSPFTRIRSLTRSRCGDVYSAVLWPAAMRMEASVAAVDPLPLVPAIKTDLNLVCGSPNELSRTRMCARSNLCDG